MRVGIAHHFGWAVAVTASDDHHVVDRRRIELVEPGTAAAPFHHEGAALDALPGPILSLSLRAWPDDFPDDLATLRRPPYEARADSVLYRQVLAEATRARGWQVHAFDAADVEQRAADLLGPRAHDVLHGPRARLGPPWGKDHRMALAATVLAAAG